jgi:hypothetical protein
LRRLSEESGNSRQLKWLNVMESGMPTSFLKKVVEVSDEPETVIAVDRVSTI